MSYDRDAMIEELRRDEGEVLHEYTDSEGYSTIGVGRLIDKRKGGGISPEESAYLLSNDIARFEQGLDQNLPWWRELSDVRQRVILNMAFNLGVPGLLKFRNTLAAVREARWEDASKGMLNSKWAKQVKGRATRLAEMMRTGNA